MTNYFPLLVSAFLDLLGEDPGTLVIHQASNLPFHSHNSFIIPILPKCLPPCICGHVRAREYVLLRHSLPAAKAVARKNLCVLLTKKILIGCPFCLHTCQLLSTNWILCILIFREHRGAIQLTNICPQVCPHQI